jgi:hypothetical protein
MLDNPYLKKVHLVKDNVVYPFFFPTLMTSILIRLKKRYSSVFKDSISIAFLDEISEFVQDLAHSSDVINYNLYDYDFIRNSVEAHYSGKQDNSKTIYWWLSFELFRQSISGENY